MPKLDVINIEGSVVSEVELPDSIFSEPYNPYPVQEVVRAQMASRRSGTHKVKGRSEIIGSKKKLYRQKGTGHARPGSVKSPLRRGGGVVFGPTPRSYAFKPPKKVRRKALCIALSKKLSDGNLTVMREFECDQPKTKDLLGRLNPGKDQTKTLFVLGTLDDQTRSNIQNSLRNVPYYKVLLADGLNVYDLVNSTKVVLLEKSIEKITERLES